MAMTTMKLSLRETTAITIARVSLGATIAVKRCIAIISSRGHPGNSRGNKEARILPTTMVTSPAPASVLRGRGAEAMFRAHLLVGEQALRDHNPAITARPGGAGAVLKLPLTCAMAGSTMPVNRITKTRQRQS